MLRSFFLLTLLLAVASAQTSLQLQYVTSWSADDVAFDAHWIENAIYDPVTQQTFALNNGGNRVDIVDFSDAANPALVSSLDLSASGTNPMAIALTNNILAVATSSGPTERGTLVLFNTNGNQMATAEIGFSPKDAQFSPDGTLLLIANEGVPSDDLQTDPPGTISVVRIFDGTTAFPFMATNLGAVGVSVLELNFDQFTLNDLDESVRIFNTISGTPLSDLEPESIAFESSGTVAWVVCQENNAVVRIDVGDADDEDFNDNFEITDIFGLGYSNAATAKNGFDGSSTDGAIRVTTHPVRQLKLPDGVANFEKDGIEYLVMANEGASRTFASFSEVARVSDVVLDFTAFPQRENLQLPSNIGNLEISLNGADTDGDGDVDLLFSFGARSFSIYDVNSQVGVNEIFESKNQIETHVAQENPVGHNAASNANQSFDTQSTKAGPKPQGVAVGEIDGEHYVFVTLENVGGVMMYEMSDVDSPKFVDYANNRDFSVVVDGNNFASAGDFAPGHVQFLPAATSPSGTNLVIVSNKVSGTISIYQVLEVPDVIFSSGFYSLGTFTTDLSTYVAATFSNVVPNTSIYYNSEYFTAIFTSTNSPVSTGRTTRRSPGPKESVWYTSYWTIDNFSNDDDDDDSSASAVSMSAAVLLFALAALL